MKTSTTMITLALACAGLATLMPAVGAIDIGCQNADATGTATVLGTPAGIATNWTPTCVIIPNGGTVQWRQADAIPHGAVDVLSGCFDLGRMSAGGSESVTLSFEDGALRTSAILADGSTSSTTCEGAPAVEGDGTLTLVYECVVHGAPMTAQIIVAGIE